MQYDCEVLCVSWGVGPCTLACGYSAKLAVITNQALLENKLVDELTPSSFFTVYKAGYSF